MQLVQRLRDQDPAVTPALRWLDERLAAQGTTADEIVREEHQRQGAMNVTVRNVITSMRLMSAVDWAEFFESVSLVDAALRAGSDFAAMDFPTRDRYRHAIEELARGSGHSELEVARRALLAAKRAGRRAAAAATRPLAASRIPATTSSPRGGGPSRRSSDFVCRCGTGSFAPTPPRGSSDMLGTIAIISAFILALSLLGVAESGVGGSALFLLALLALVPASDAAVALVNHHVTNQFGPTALPALELRDGVPSSLRTMVVVPTLLTTRSGDRGADRAPRGSSSGESGGRSPLCAALGLDGLRHARVRPATTSFSAPPPRASPA